MGTSWPGNYDTFPTHSAGDIVPSAGWNDYGAALMAMQRQTGVATVRSVNAVTDIGIDPTGVTATDTLLNNALSALPAQGGVIEVPAGLYKVSSGWAITQIKPIMFVLAPGARLQAGANGITLLQIANTSAPPRSANNQVAYVYGGTLDPNGHTGIIGCQVLGSNTALLQDINVYGGAAVGFDFFNSGTGSFTESLVCRRLWVDTPAVGFRWRRDAAADVSMGQGDYYGLHVNQPTQYGCQFGDTTANNISLYRSQIHQAVVWVGANNNVSAYYMGNIDITGADMTLTTENTVGGSPTGLYGLQVDTTGGTPSLSRGLIRLKVDGTYNAAQQNPSAVALLIQDLNQQLRTEYGRLTNPATGTANSIATNATINPRAGGASVQRFKPTAAVSNITLGLTGIIVGEEVFVSNEAAFGSGFSITFGAGGNTFNGANDSIAAGVMARFQAIPGAWIRIQ